MLKQHWPQVIPVIEAQMNNMVHRVTGYRPIDLWPLGPAVWTKVNDKMEQCREQVNASRKPRQARHFEPWQRVWVYNLRGHDANDKLRRFWLGPAVILRRISNSIWRVRLTEQVHDINVHESLIRPYLDIYI